MKVLFVNDIITDHKLDVLCLTETWLKPDEYNILNESAPQDYCYKNEPRPKGKGGGVATIYSNTLSISQKTGFKYNSFEEMALQRVGVQYNNGYKEWVCRWRTSWLYE